MLILQRNNNTIGVLRESVRSLDLRLSGVFQQLEVSAKASSRSTAQTFAG